MSAVLDQSIYFIQDANSNKLISTGTTGDSAPALLVAPVAGAAQASSVRWSFRAVNVGNFDPASGPFLIQNLSSGFYLDGRAPTGDVQVWSSNPHGQNPDTDAYYHWTVSFVGINNSGHRQFNFHSVSSGQYLSAANNVATLSTGAIPSIFNLALQASFQIKSLSSGKFINAGGADGSTAQLTTNASTAVFTLRVLPGGQFRVFSTVNPLLWLDGRNLANHNVLLTG
eukprot:gene8683-11048_t